ncbi:RHS repeat-associated core domain-containing protein [Pseudomonas viridiflava]|uniref:RHS repeat-associated core domain-containing protein n=1 Tax=Pseudomonas viridiflava TaxID=33069 RepID=UPI0035BF1BBA
MSPMISAARATRCLYQYDPLDRLARSTTTGRAGVKCFYRKNHLTTHIQGQITRTLLHADGLLLAQQHHDDQTVDCALLATDQQGSTLATPQSGFSYTPYGSRHPQTNAMNLPAFTGQQADEMTGHYLLGNGYRAFNPILMRFNSPDSFSPFGEGGLNAYAYCVGDPVNRVDPSGRTAAFLKTLLRAVGVMKKATTNVQLPNLVSETLQSTNTISTALLIPREIPVQIKSLKLGPRKSLANGVYMFDELNDDGTLGLTINAHGAAPLSNRGPRLVSNEKQYISPRGLIGLLEKNNVNMRQYENIHVIGCGTADGGDISFAAKLAAMTGKPTQGYRGWVTNKNMRAIRSEDNAGAPQIAITNPFERGDHRWKQFNYDPVWFT